MGKLLKNGREYGGSGDGNWLIQDVNFDTKDTWLVPVQPGPPEPNVDEYTCEYVDQGIVFHSWTALTDKKYDLQSLADFLDTSKIKLEVLDRNQNLWLEMGEWYSTSGNGMAANARDGSNFRFWFDLDDTQDQRLDDKIYFGDIEFQKLNGDLITWNEGYKGYIRLTYLNVKQDQSVLQPTKVTEQRRITRGSDYLKQELGEYMFTGLNTVDMDALWNSTLPEQINPDNILYDLRRVSTGELQVCQNEIVIGKVMRPNGEMSDAKRCIVVISGVANNMTYYTDLPFKNQIYRVLNMSGALHKYGDDGTTFGSYPLPYYRNNSGEELKAYITNSNGEAGVLGFKVGADIINNESTFGILTIDYYTF